MLNRKEKCAVLKNEYSAYKCRRSQAVMHFRAETAHVQQDSVHCTRFDIASNHAITEVKRLIVEYYLLL